MPERRSLPCSAHEQAGGVAPPDESATYRRLSAEERAGWSVAGRCDSKEGGTGRREGRGLADAARSERGSRDCGSRGRAGRWPTSASVSLRDGRREGRSSRAETVGQRGAGLGRRRRKGRGREGGREQGRAGRGQPSGRARALLFRARALSRFAPHPAPLVCPCEGRGVLIWLGLGPGVGARGER
jgi:hypothetical protein